MFARRVTTSFSHLSSLVVGKDPVVQFSGLLGGDRVEIDAVQDLERPAASSDKARCAGVVEIVLARLPPLVERLAGRPGRQSIDAADSSCRRRCCAASCRCRVGVVQVGNFAERPQMVVRIDRGHGVERGLDAGVERRGLDVGLGRQRRCSEPTAVGQNRRRKRLRTRELLRLTSSAQLTCL